MGPRTTKSATSKVAAPVDSIFTNESENDSDLNTNLFPDNPLTGSPIISRTTWNTDKDSSVAGKRSSEETENSSEETDKNRRKRLKTTTLQAAIEASLITERQASQRLHP
jgi:hypothetical protein